MRLSAEGSEEADRPRLLLADDDRTSRLFAATLLQRHGLHVEAVEDGSRAVEAAAAAAYDLILLDRQMPELDGWTAAAQIRGLSPETADLPIFILSADAPEAEELHVGIVDAYLVKPLRLQALRDAIASLSVEGRDAVPALDRTISAGSPEADTSGLAALPVLDPAVLDALEAAYGAEMRRIMQVFQSETAERLCRMGEMLRGGVDAAGLLRNAHALKGGAAVFGCAQLSAAAARLENTARGCPADAAIQAFDQVQRAGRLALAALERRFGPGA